MKTILKIGLIFFFIGCATQNTAIQDQPLHESAYLAFDFNTDQSIVPLEDYGAAYIINVSGQTISIPLSTWDNSTMFSHFYYDEFGFRPVFTEMMLARINRNDFLVLEPGARVLAFSVAFFHENLELYPDAMYDARIYIDGKPVDIRGFVVKSAVFNSAWV